VYKKSSSPPGKIFCILYMSFLQISSLNSSFSKGGVINTINTLIASNVTSDTITIIYSGIFDNVNILVDNVSYATTSLKTYSITGRAYSTSYSITVVPYKNSVAGNSKQINVVTQQLTDVFNGATITTSGSYRFITFTGNGNLKLARTTTANTLIVGGGGSGSMYIAGGYGAGGGGGGGGVGIGTLNLVLNTVYNITVGSGGTFDRTNTISSNGGNSIINGGSINEIAYGGGRAGGHIASTVVYNAGSGGSAGGISSTETDSLRPYGNVALKGSGTLIYYGNVGGNSYRYTSEGGGSGGGGAVGIGGNAGVITINPYTTDRNAGGNGGAGIQWNVNGSYYGGGGGGGSSNGKIVLGGTGGGGRGSNYGSNNSTATAGTANTGGGGGGGSQSGMATNIYPGNGGSGVVIFRLPI
jgi:hypothetical protein